MKIARLAIAGLLFHVAGSAYAAETLRAAWFVRDISCKVGSLLAGYGPKDVSVAKFDDLQLHGLALDDGKTKTLLMSFVLDRPRLGAEK